MYVNINCCKGKDLTNNWAKSMQDETFQKIVKGKEEFGFKLREVTQMSPNHIICPKSFIKTVPCKWKRIWLYISMNA